MTDESTSVLILAALFCACCGCGLWGLILGGVGVMIGMTAVLGYFDD